MKLILLLFVLQLSIFAQKIIEEYKPPEGFLRIGPEQEQMIPMVEKGFTLILPETDDVNGIVVIQVSERTDAKESLNTDGTPENEFLKKNIAVIHITSGNPVDFYFSDDIIKDVVKRLESVLSEQMLKDKPVYFTGFSLAGTRALKTAIYLQQNREKYWLQPSAVAVIDAPLDMVRYWDEVNRAIINDYYPDAVNEGKRFSFLLKENLGTPEDNFNKYVDHSPFIYKARDGGNAEYLRNIPVRAYHEPDINWWIENRRKDYYSMNSIDLAGLINQLRLLHNEEAELITVHQERKGSNENTPRTDALVDYGELADWFLSHRY